ncbi:MAG TPA: ABC transporter ATP-binding protein [Flavobacteriaceae bacterium]|nr:ABC transporter ATP-binding protein [Flavobacteriaceae bacterium]
MEKKLLINVESLRVSFKSQSGLKEVIKGISYSLYKNEILGVVGESGSGKSVSSLAIMGLLPKQTAVITNGHISFKQQDLTQLNEKSFQKIRGKKISMIFQEPMSSLNPSMRCGKQVAEILLTHKICSKSEVKQRVLDLFEKVKLPNPERVYKAYPHEISGGQKQRVMIAMAIACEPDILIADEPTTALDVTVQRDIINLLESIQLRSEMSIIFISHDLSLVSEIADRILVMYQGEIVEQGAVRDIFKSPKHTYTQALLKSRPPLNVRFKKLPTIKDVLDGHIPQEIISSSDRKLLHEKLYAQTPILEVVDLEKTYISKTGLMGKTSTFKAVDGVSFKVFEGETLGLVGESGCGKSTLGNAIMMLDKPTHGAIFYKGKDITKFTNSEIKTLRKDIQVIFQDPFASLNPRLTVGEAIMEPMKVFGLYNSKLERKKETISLLEKVGLTEEAFYRYPHEFSGGQRQRIGIARTIALQPKLIICDESVSALDISVQAQVLNLLNSLKESFGFSYIFISHDLAVVKYMSDQLVVMNQGKIEEKGDADAIYDNPQKAYTKKLIQSIPKGS